MFRIKPNAKGKSYKQLSKCNHCGKRYVIEDSTDPEKRYQSRFYCPDCYKIAYPKNKPKEKATVKHAF